eukprot:6207305-Pleurochrysis_carterae.AAC.2
MARCRWRVAQSESKKPVTGASQRVKYSRSDCPMARQIHEDALCGCTELGCRAATYCSTHHANCMRDVGARLSRTIEEGAHQRLIVVE